MSTEPLRVLSLGGGTQSCALALMSAKGDLPKLDAVVFADTGGELPETYDYLRWMQPVVEGSGIKFLWVSNGNLEQAVVNPTGRWTPRLPAHVKNPDGSDGRISQYTCSFDFKRRAIARATKSLVGGRGAWKKPGCVEQWIGMSVDEIGRCKPAAECICGHAYVRHHKGNCAECICHGKLTSWQINRWPLVELSMRRSDTIRWFEENGFPTPSRSACWFCPNAGNDRWRDLKQRHPDLWERACVIDASIRTWEGIEGKRYLHTQRVDLVDVDLRTKAQIAADQGQQSLFDPDVDMDCSAGVCFT